MIGINSIYFLVTFPHENHLPKSAFSHDQAEPRRLGMMWFHDVHAGQLAMGPAAFRHVLAMGFHSNFRGTVRLFLLFGGDVLSNEYVNSYVNWVIFTWATLGCNHKWRTNVHPKLACLRHLTPGGPLASLPVFYGKANGKVTTKVSFKKQCPLNARRLKSVR